MVNTAAQLEQDWLSVNLVHRAQAGDSNAFDHLAKHCRPLLFALAFVRTSHKDEAEDLVQDVLIKAWQKLPSLVDAASFLPWLKTVMANACISWYRRSCSRPESLNEEFARLLVAEQGLPLKTLLEQDRQRELQQALLILPEANRLALLMHIWGHVSYDDIATFTGVYASTVDGRIYRAKRQMRRLLYDGGAEFLGEEHRPWQPAPALDELSPKRRKRMPSTKPTAMTDTWERPLTLVLFTRRFSLMLDAGVSLLRALEILQEMPSPFGEATTQLRAKVERGEYLSQAMADRPDLFPPVYIGMIRAGEVGHVLEETVQRLKKVIAREWNLANRCPSNEAPLFLLLPADKAVPGKWAEMSAYQQTVTLSLFFETFGTLLQSGVPIVQAMHTVADLLPQASQEGWIQVIRCVYPAGELFSPEMKRMGIFPDFAVEMILIGEKSGSLDAMMHSLAESFDDDLKFQTLP